MHSSLKLLITLTFLVIFLPNQHMAFSYPKLFVMLGSAVRKVICWKGLRASPKNYYGNTTPSMAWSHHWRNVWRNIAGSQPNWAQDFTRTSQKNNWTSQKNYYQHSRNFWNFLFLLIIPITQASRCTTGWSDSGCWGGWHFIAAIAINPPKAACQFAADDILLYEFCYYSPMDLLHHLEKGQEELSPLQYHIKSLHIISRHDKKSLLRSQIYHGYEELSTDTNSPIWRRQERRSKYAVVQLASWQLRSNSPKMSVRLSVNFTLFAQ